MSVAYAAMMLLTIPVTPGVGFPGATGRGGTRARGEIGGSAPR